MIMMNDRKKTVAAILGTPKSVEDETSADLGGSEALKAIAEELIDAVHNKDADAVCEAFKAMFLECETQPHEEYESEDGE